MSIREVRNRRDYLLAYAADLALRLPAALIGALRGGKSAAPAGTPGKILVMRADNIGDVVMATSLVHELKKSFRDASIDVLVRPEAATLLKDDPDIDNIIAFEGYRSMARVRAGSYDTAIEPRGDIRHILFLFLSGIRRRVGFDRAGGSYMLTDVVPYETSMSVHERNMAIVKYLDNKSGADGYTALYETRAGIKEAEGLIRFLGGGKILGIFPCSKFASKEWEPRKFGELAVKASGDGFTPVICGSAADAGKCAVVAGHSGGKAVNCAGKLSLEGLVSFIKRCECVIANDSAPAHIAEALGVPAVAIYGPIDPGIVRPHLRPGGKYKAVFKRLPCSFCNSIKVLPAKCRGKGPPECLEKIGVDDVYSSLRELTAR